MQISCDTFEAFVVTLSRNSHGFGELNYCHSHIQPILCQINKPRNSCSIVSWQVQHSPPDVHSDLRPSPLWHSVAWRYFDNAPFPTHATTNAHAFDRVVLQGRSRPIPVFYRNKWLSSPCRRLLQSTTQRSKNGVKHHIMVTSF